MPRTKNGFISTKEYVGTLRARKIFEQDIVALLTDERAFQISCRFAYFYPLMSKTEIFEWVADNIGDEHEPLEITEEEES